MLDFANNLIGLFIESAPWLLLGFIVAGLIKSFVPTDFLSRHLGGKGLKATVKAAVIGAPLPLCSCGVVPAALGLRRSGASKNSTVSFLVATPETGVDSIAVTYALLGPVMAIVRPIAAIFSGILSGVLVGKAEASDGSLAASADAEKATSSCCSSKSSCSSELPPVTKQPSVYQRLVAGVGFSFHDMLKDIAFWLLIGLAFAAAVQTWVPASFLAQWGSGFIAFVVMALIGVPMYICATASTPIAAGLLMAGVSPGAVLVFMMAGPATNLGTLAIVGKELGKRALVAYLGGVVIASFLFGYLLNLLVESQAWDISGSAHQHMASEGLFAQLCALVLGIAILRLVWIDIRVRYLTPSPKETGCCAKTAESKGSDCCSKS
ncbi:MULTISPECIES: SO_0444 family Cu/Zn efflux transporter [Corallincola]|uniref:Permease n=2 Tax=Corallincola TaxID=1775176 RepID=A0ABY1WTE1_9GAMM|nr:MULTISPECIES: SO_0444 family Cu/Zn efflux transporter [Corallincola]TAA47903.1 permease [Corallincola spongiicola]TCI01946.1 permease [Corallincola luteus]